jgi:hypothetical protein
MQAQALELAPQNPSSAAAVPTAFDDLPATIQSLILALAGAPLHTCKCGEAVAKDQHLTAIWLVARVGLPLWAAARMALWDVCHHLLSSTYYRPSAQEVRAVMVVVARNGQTQLVHRLLHFNHVGNMTAAALRSNYQPAPPPLLSSATPTGTAAAAEDEAASLDQETLRAALFAAVMSGHASVVEVLLDHVPQGARVPGKQRTSGKQEQAWTCPSHQAGLVA